MNVWYLAAFLIGIVLYCGFTLFSRYLPWKAALLAQLSILGLILVLLAVFLFWPGTANLIDRLFS